MKHVVLKFGIPAISMIGISHVGYDINAEMLELNQLKLSLWLKVFCSIVFHKQKLGTVNRILRHVDLLMWRFIIMENVNHISKLRITSLVPYRKSITLLLIMGLTRHHQSR